MTADEEALFYWRRLPPLRITMREALKLHEYSATNPTGVIPGKRWRRNNGSFDNEFILAGGRPRWVICEYQEAPPEWRSTHEYDREIHQYKKKLVEMCKTMIYRPVIRVKMERAEA